MTHVLIIGAGPAGLTAGYELVNKGYSVTILEQDNVVGGISRTIKHKGYRFDIGGHRFFTKNKKIEKWWHKIMGDDFLIRPRLSRWYYNHKFFNYPIKPFEMLRVFGLVESSKIFSSYIKAKIFPIKPETSLADWSINSFGSHLAEPFFIDYNKKLWGENPSQLSKDFANQRVKGISFLSAVWQACKASLGIKDTKVKSLINEFKYPKHGPGMLWERVRDKIIEKGGIILTGHKALSIILRKGKIDGVLVKGRGIKQSMYFLPSHILSTMPLKELILSIESDTKVPKKVLASANCLKFRDFVTVALMINQKETIPDTWVYTHDQGVRAIRAQIFKNWSPFMVPKGMSCIGFEYTYNKDKDSPLSNEDWIEIAKEDLKRLGFAAPSKVIDAKVVKLINVYPVYSLDYKEKIKMIKDYIQKFGNTLQPIGRGGLHRYNNMDHSMMTAFLAVENITENKNFDQWEVNSDAEYHEEI